MRFDPAPDTKPIEDPVRVWSPIRGVAFRYESARTTAPIYLDCRFALRLADAADLWRRSGVTELRHWGAFHVKCVGGGSPATRPGCRLSQHALGMALDVSGFTVNGLEVNVASDFERRVPTCMPQGTFTPRGSFLQTVACRSFDAGIFDIVLTPNFDAEHYDHIHFDLQDSASRPRAIDPPVSGAAD